MCVCLSSGIFQSSQRGNRDIPVCVIVPADFELPDEASSRPQTVSVSVKTSGNQLPVKLVSGFESGFFLFSAMSAAGRYSVVKKAPWQNSSLPAPDIPVRAGPAA